jgi:hypothetical protein
MWGPKTVQTSMEVVMEMSLVLRQMGGKMGERKERG